MKQREAFLVTVLIAALFHPLVHAAQRDANNPQWRSSWVVFVEAIDAYRKSGGELPAATFDMLLRGQRVPEKAVVMKQFGGQVTFDGTFQGVTTDDLMEGTAAKVTIEMPKAAAGALLHLYASSRSVAAWRSVPAGTSVKFAATIAGIAVTEPIPGRFGHIVVLENAEPVK